MITCIFESKIFFYFLVIQNYIINNLYYDIKIYCSFNNIVYSIL